MPSRYDQSSSEKFIAVTPDDDATLAIRGFHVGGDGDVVATDAYGDDVTFKKCKAGAYYPYAVRKIKAATTASDIVGLV